MTGLEIFLIGIIAVLAIFVGAAWWCFYKLITEIGAPLF